MYRAWIKIFDISAEISAKYRISVTTEAKLVMENRLREKSLKYRKFRRYFADISVSGRNFGEISVSGTHARCADFLLQNIGDISEISVKYRRYIGKISEIYRKYR